MSGTGIGLRAPHLEGLLRQRPPVPWFELLADNWLHEEAEDHAKLERLRADAPFALHGVGLSLGGVAPLDLDYLRSIQRLIERYDASWYSEHLCWSSTADAHFHELLPLPYTEEAITHVAARIAQVQDVIGSRLVVENVSTYLQFSHSTLRESEFVAAVAEVADCEILLDVQNVYVAARNHGVDGAAYLLEIPAERVREIHLAGGEEREGFLLDTHSRPVPEEVWSLYALALSHCGEVPTLVEWDNEIPELSVLLAEASRAERVAKGSLR